MPPHQREPQRVFAKGRESIEPDLWVDAASNAWRCAQVECIRRRLQDFSAKLGMDWPHLLRLRGVMTEDDQHRSVVVGSLFALLTAKFEDGAEMAARGQDPASIDRIALASGILSIGQEIVAIADGILLALNTEG